MFGSGSGLEREKERERDSENTKRGSKSERMCDPGVAGAGNDGIRMGVQTYGMTDMHMMMGVWRGVDDEWGDSGSGWGTAGVGGGGLRDIITRTLGTGWHL